jgi:hypothetical protein
MRVQVVRPGASLRPRHSGSPGRGGDPPVQRRCELGDDERKACRPVLEERLVRPARLLLPLTADDADSGRLQRYVPSAVTFLSGRRPRNAPARCPRR